ncbi:MAG TPA: RsmG family class I SAM-dependent methyltransferase [Acidimicrobiales bacterium]|nr:RsmG family class I SAM-dependent methyltransferase [Acidimicrobiales bacterium]
MGGLLDEVLGDAQHRGFLGSGEIDGFVRHALGYLEGLGEVAGQGDGADLGPGGGIPGLVLAAQLPATNWHLIERSRGRADWLTRAVARLGMADRVMVHHEAAEIAGRGPLRSRCGFVVARRFAAPAVAAECAAPLLRVGGRAVFSDLRGPSGPLSGGRGPSGPLSGARWDEDQLAILGMVLVRSWQSDEGTYVLLEQRTGCPDRFPRSPGVPVRRPLF